MFRLERLSNTMNNLKKHKPNTLLADKLQAREQYVQKQLESMDKKSIGSKDIIFRS